MAKILPCKDCRQPALATKDGVLQTAGQLFDRVTKYACRRCGRLQSITSMEFAVLPEISVEELRANASIYGLPPSAADPTPGQ